MRIPLATLVAFLLVAAPASAQATATATPNKAGKGTRLHLELDAAQPPVSGRLPTSTTLSIQAGTGFDAKAVARRCTAQQAEDDKCPKTSRVGAALVTAKFGGDAYPVPLRLFLAKPLQAGDLAGVAAVATVLGSPYAATGRIVRTTVAPFGLQVVLPTPGQLTGLPVTFERFTADIGTSRIVRGPRRKNKPRKKVRHHLITNPKACTAPWASRAEFAFADGSTAALDAPIACVP